MLCIDGGSILTKTNSGGTEQVCFYDLRADGISLNDRRNPGEADDLSDVRLGGSKRIGSEGERVPSSCFSSRRPTSCC